MRGLSWVLLFLAIGSIGSPLASGDHYSYRQYYGDWSYRRDAGYWWRPYYYKPHGDYAGYKHHYCVWHNDHRDYYYYYNPYQKYFWGRCPVDHGGQPVYSLLKEEDRKGSLAEIPESAFPEAGPLPPIPESSDSVSLGGIL